MKAKIKNLLKFAIGWPLSLLALYFIAKTFLPKSQEIAQNLSNMNGWLLGIGMLCFLMYYFLRSIVWQLLLTGFGYKVPLHETIFLWASSEFKRYIPGNIWSFLGRTISFSEKGVRKKDVARGLLIEAEMILIGCIFVSFLSVSFLKQHIFPFLSTIPYLPQFLMITVVVSTMLLLYLRFFINKFPKKMQPFLRHVLPDFAPQLTFQMICYSTIAFFFLGLGYYFTIISITSLHPQQWISYTGFFVFSLLVGLLSFITPTGLGVREGTITLGLAKVMPVSLAGFVSLFGRIILILAEIVFIIIAFAFYTSRRKSVERMQTFFTNYIPETILTISILLFSIYFSLISFLRHDNFYTGRFDLGNMDQTVWNTAQGRIFQFTNPDGVENVSRLAFHADFILVLLAPFYYIWSDPKMLLLIQAVVVGLGAIFVYLLARDLLQNKLLALTLAGSYLLNPSVQRATIYDFHAVTLTTTFLLGAFYFIYKKRYGWFIIFAILAGITKEQIWLIIAFLGLYIAARSCPFQIKKNWKIIYDKWNRKEFVLGALVFVISGLLFYSLIWHAIPQSSQSSQHFALGYFAGDNESPSDLVKNIFLSPDTTLEKVFDEGRRDYMKKLLLPLGYLPLGALWLAIFPSADLALNFLSDKEQLHQIYYQYTAAISPFLFIACMYAILYLRKLIPQVPVFCYTGFIAFFALYGAYLYGPLPGAKEPNIAMITKPAKDKDMIQTAIRKIDAKYSVTATNNIGAHLSHRERLYNVPHGMGQSDFIVFLMTEGTMYPPREWHEEKLSALEKNGTYIQWLREGNLIIYKKK